MNNKHYIICANATPASIITKLLPPDKEITQGTLMCITEKGYVDACSKGKIPVGVACNSVSTWKTNGPISVGPLGQPLRVLLGDAVQAGDALGFLENGVAQKLQKGMLHIGYAMESGTKGNLIAAVTKLPSPII